MTFATILEALGLSNRRAAHMLGCSRPTIIDWRERGVPLSKILAVAAVLDLNDAQRTALVNERVAAELAAGEASA